MTRITLDAMLREKLKDLTEVLELCDEHGKVIGRLYPVGDPSKRPPWEPPPLSKEEWERRRHNGEWLTTEQAIAYLEKLGCFR